MGRKMWGAIRLQRSLGLYHIIPCLYISIRILVRPFPTEYGEKKMDTFEKIPENAMERAIREMNRKVGTHARLDVLAQILERVVHEEIHDPGVVTPDAISMIVAKLSKASVNLAINFHLPPWAVSRLRVAPASIIPYKKMPHHRRIAMDVHQKA